MLLSKHQLAGASNSIADNRVQAQYNGEVFVESRSVKGSTPQRNVLLSGSKPFSGYADFFGIGSTKSMAVQFYHDDQIATDASTSATILLGDSSNLGMLRLGPSTKLKFAAAGETNFALELVQGSMVIWFSSMESTQSFIVKIDKLLVSAGQATQLRALLHDAQGCITVGDKDLEIMTLDGANKQRLSKGQSLDFSAAGIVGVRQATGQEESDAMVPQSESLRTIKMPIFLGDFRSGSASHQWLNEQWDSSPKYAEIKSFRAENPSIWLDVGKLGPKTSGISVSLVQSGVIRGIFPVSIDRRGSDSVGTGGRLKFIWSVREKRSGEKRARPIDSSLLRVLQFRMRSKHVSAIWADGIIEPGNSTRFVAPVLVPDGDWQLFRLPIANTYFDPSLRVFYRKVAEESQEYITSLLLKPRPQLDPSKPVEPIAIEIKDLEILHCPSKTSD
jgi:hypothetical protein